MPKLNNLDSKFLEIFHYKVALNLYLIKPILTSYCIAWPIALCLILIQLFLTLISSCSVTLLPILPILPLLLRYKNLIIARATLLKSLIPHPPFTRLLQLLGVRFLRLRQLYFSFASYGMQVQRAQRRPLHKSYSLLYPLLELQPSAVMNIVLFLLL